MKNSDMLIRSAIAGMLALSFATASTAALAAVDKEKCYGISKAGKNDCGTATSSCAGTSKLDNDPNVRIRSAFSLIKPAASF